MSDVTNERDAGKAGFTPGPWVMDQTDTYETALVSGDGRVVASAAWDGGSGCHLKVSDANARLIAAAPDLLAALEDIAAYPLPFVEDAEQRLQLLIGFMDLARSAARAAIGRATGAA